jgi:hypothetical protein
MTLSGACGHPVDLPALLDATARNGVGSSAMFFAKCPVCGEGTELRLENGRATIGYSYFGGSMHSEPMKTFRVAGLRVEALDPDDLNVRLGDRHWHFSVDAPSRLRFVVFERAYAAGKALSDLDFARWHVTVAQVERGAARFEPDPGLVVEPGDFLHLRGPAPALTRAWHYMNDGRGG